MREVKGAATVEWVEVGNLRDDPRNSRIHPKSQIEQIKASILEFGFTNPILVDGEGVIIAGHGRMVAAKELAMEKVPTIVLGYLTPTQRRALVIADNKIALNASWDEKLLAEELESLKLEGFDLSSMGLEGEGGGEKYTNKITSPCYEPGEEKPAISELFDDEKVQDLVEEIRASMVSPEEKAFLEYAAGRHRVFNYRAIADFYAHSGEEMQRLMERSALVIIDYQRAIEEGYIKLSLDIDALMDGDTDGE